MMKWYDYSYKSYFLEELMEVNNGKYAWMVKIGEKGQFVIPKEARNLFNLQPGMEILVLGDEKEISGGVGGSTGASYGNGSCGQQGLDLGQQ